MPEAETSQFHQSSNNRQPISSSTKPLASSELQEVHWLIVKDDQGQQHIPLGGELYSIGRDTECDIRLFSLFVSRRHATLVRRQRDDGNYCYQIVNGNLQGQLSANGIVINGHKVQSYNLKNEDKVVFGPGVSAIYRLHKRNNQKSGPLDPFDITLIDPGMVEEQGK